MVGILLKLSCGQPFPGQGFPEKDIIGPRFSLSHIYYIKVMHGAGLIQGWLIWKAFGCIENAQNLAQPKKCGKKRQTPFLDAFEVSGSESEVRISIKILVLKLSNLMTLIVHNCTAKTGTLRNDQRNVPEIRGSPITRQLAGNTIYCSDKTLLCSRVGDHGQSRSYLAK